MWSSCYLRVLGDMFEDFVHNNLTQGHSLEMKKLSPYVKASEADEAPFPVTFPKIDHTLKTEFPVPSKVKNSRKKDAKTLDLEPKKLYIPMRPNQPQVDSLLLLEDAVTLQGLDYKLFLFQATISDTHTFIPHYIELLVKNLNYQNKESKPKYAFVFVVDRNSIKTFKYQTRLGVDKKVMKTTKGINIPQYALALPGDIFATFSMCIQKLEKELRHFTIVDVVEPTKDGREEQ